MLIQGKRRRSTAIGAVAVVTVGLALFIILQRAQQSEAAAVSEVASLDHDSRLATSGAVTDDEFERAIADTVACLEGEGLEVTLFPRDRQRPTVFRVSAPDADGVPDRQTVDAAQKATAGCRAQYLNDIADAWYLAHEPTADELEALYAGLEQCVANRAVPSSDSRAWFFVGYPNEPRSIRIPTEAMDVYAECAWEFWAETGFVAPIPAE